jgi:hypothetical protein
VNIKQPLLQRWISFLNVVVDPWIAILSSISVIVICMNIYNDNRVITLVLSLLLVLTSGIMGARLVKIWSY